MPRRATDRRTSLRHAAMALGLVALLLGAGPEEVQTGGAGAPTAPDAKGRPSASGQPGTTAEWVTQQLSLGSRRFAAWYRATPPADRITWGALGAAAALGLLTLLERSARVRRGRAIPGAFRDRFRARLAEGKLDWAKGLDFCELNPSPAARVALAALRRWGRPAPDLDRAVAMARQSETDRMRRHVGTLRRIAALSPLIGLLGSLVSASRALAALPPGAAWGPAIASALAPLTAGVGLAILALVAYDGLMGRVENLSGELDRLGAEVVDALAPLTTPTPAHASSRERTASTGHQVRVEPPAARPRTPHAVRVEIPERFASREFDRDEV